jgi:hypothetical protein
LNSPIPLESFEICYLEKLIGKTRQRDEVTSLRGEAKTCLGDCSMRLRQPSTLRIVN